MVKKKLYTRTHAIVLRLLLGPRVSQSVHFVFVCVRVRLGFDTERANRPPTIFQLAIVFAEEIPHNNNRAE